MTEMFILTGEKVGGNLDTHYDAIGNYLTVPFLAQLFLSVKTADSKAQQVL